MATVNERTRGVRWGVAVASMAFSGVLSACSATSDAGPADQTPVSVDESAQARTGERITVDGVTFVVPDQLVAEFERAPDSIEVGRADVTVVLYDQRATELGTVRVARVRDGRGSMVASPADEATVRSLDGDGTSGDALAFVNGSGVREASDGGYRFVGLTTSGTHLVEILAAPEAEVGSMDALTTSLFVDGQAPAGAAPSCDVAVEVITEVVVDNADSLAPGDLVVASWRVRNAGTCPWTSGDGWVFAGGDPVTVVEVSPVGEQEPGDEAEVTVTLRAPTEAGRYATQWQFLPAGELQLIDTPIPVAFEVIAG